MQLMFSHYALEQTLTFFWEEEEQILPPIFKIFPPLCIPLT